MVLIRLSLPFLPTSLPLSGLAPSHKCPVLIEFNLREVPGTETENQRKEGRTMTACCALFTKDALGQGSGRRAYRYGSEKAYNLWKTSLPQFDTL